MTLLTRFALATVSVFALSACKEIKVDRGEIPDEYRAMALRYMGTYQGRMDGETASLRLALNGRKAVLAYADRLGQDILEPRCGSKIGDLLSVRVSKKDDTYKLDSATFAFDPANCWPSVKGRTVVLDFKEKSSGMRVEASILLDERWDRQCRIEPGNPSRGIPPQQVCEDRPIATYATGRFTKP